MVMLVTHLHNSVCCCRTGKVTARWCNNMVRQLKLHIVTHSRFHCIISLVVVLPAV